MSMRSRPCERRSNSRARRLSSRWSRPARSGGSGPVRQIPFGGADVGELLVERRQLLVVRRVAAADDHGRAHETSRVVVAVEAEDLLDGDADVVGDPVERPVLGVDQAPARHLVQEALAGPPSTGRRAGPAARSGRARPCRSASRVSSSKHSSRVPKPPGRTAKAADSFINMSLRVKKYFISTTRPSAASWGCEIVSKGSRISTPSDMSGPAPSAPGRHDARTGAGDDEPVLGGHARRRGRPPGRRAGRRPRCAPSRTSSASGCPGSGRKGRRPAPSRRAPRRRS